MTDSASGLNGPNLKFAALSVDSYHLDSPPFTGVASGAGSGVDQLDAVGRRIAKGPHSYSSTGNSRNGSSRSRSASSSSSCSSPNGSHINEDPLSRSNAELRRDGQRRRSRETSSSSTSSQRNATYREPVHPSNHDVPSWDLDGQRYASTSSSITPRHSMENSSPTTMRTVIHDGSRRPLHTQLTQDADGVIHDDDPMRSSQHEPDQEVDGDGTGFVLRCGDASVASHDEIVPIQSQRKADYNFPRHRLPLKMRDESKIPLVIVACGSFSPPTYLHLRIFEMAKDQVIESGKYELLAGYYSPVSDHYRKAGLAQARHRVRMCELAVEKTSTWLMVDAWESLQDEYQRTAVVLDHFNEELNGPLKSTTDTSGGPPQPINGGVLLNDGRRRRIKIMLLAGGDLIQSMGEPGVWADTDLHHILGRYGCMIVERTGADVWSFLLSHDLLWKYRRNLKIVKQTIYNDISSSKVRLFVRRGQSIKYLLPNSVIKYIEQNALVSRSEQAMHQSPFFQLLTSSRPHSHTVPPTC